MKEQIDFSEVKKELLKQVLTKKERISSFPSEVKKKLLRQVLTKLDEVNNHWQNINDNSGIIGGNAQSCGMHEWEVRNLEKEVAGELAAIDFNREDLTEEDSKIINNYLSMGDIGILQEIIAKKADIEYRDPFDDNPTHASGSAEQILKEIEKEKKLN
ncbi:MAG: hypothetical protein V1667_01990 [bacterium]